MARPSTIEFLKTESGAGVLLALATLAAVILANSPAAAGYFAFINAPVPIRAGAFEETRSVIGWSRDGLMAVFFLVLGLQIKFEVARGEFSSPRRLALPILAALGGMAGPAIVYLAVSAGRAGASAGWPIPIPTDTAFSLAALAVFGRGLPQSLRLFLLTLAVASDLGAVVLIGLLFSTPIHAGAATGVAASLAALAALSRWKATPRLFYAAGFVLAWAFALNSGISPLPVLFACALTVPIGPRRADQESVLKTFQDALHPYVAFGVLPVFAFVSAGFRFDAIGVRDLIAPAPLGVALGLTVGKPVGVMAASVLAVVLRIGRRPMGALWLELAGVALLCGGGLTMSFLMAALAFDVSDPARQGALRAAVIAGSLVSVLAGGAVLAWARARREAFGVAAE